MRISVNVKTKSKYQKMEEVSKNSFVIWITSAPIENKANKEIMKILAYHFNVPKTRIKIKSGEHYKEKVFEIML